MEPCYFNFPIPLVSSARRVRAVKLGGSQDVQGNFDEGASIDRKWEKTKKRMFEQFRCTKIRTGSKTALARLALKVSPFWNYTADGSIRFQLVILIEIKVQFCMQQLQYCDNKPV